MAIDAKITVAAVNPRNSKGEPKPRWRCPRPGPLGSRGAPWGSPSHTTGPRIAHPESGDFRRNPRNRVPVPVKNPSYPSILYIPIVSTIRGIGDSLIRRSWSAADRHGAGQRRSTPAFPAAGRRSSSHRNRLADEALNSALVDPREPTGRPAAQHETTGELTGSRPTMHACQLTQYERGTPVSSASAPSAYPIETGVLSSSVTRRVADLLPTWASLQRRHRRAACFSCPLSVTKHRSMMSDGT